PFLISARFCASLIEGAVIRTYSHPASIILMLCSTEPAVSIVSTVVMDCKRIGCSPPKGIVPTRTSRVLNLEYWVMELQYFPAKELISAALMNKNLHKNKLFLKEKAPIR